MKCIKYIFLGTIFGVVFGVSYLGENQADMILLNDVVLKLSFNEFILCKSNAAYYDKIFLYLVPMLIFQLLSGTEIYSHFCTGSIYYFSRCTNKKVWTIKESAKVAVYSFINTTAILLSFLFVNNIAGKEIVFSFGAICVAGYYILIFSLWNLFFSIIINVLSLKFKSHFSFSIASGLEVLFSLIYVALQDVLYKVYDHEELAVTLIKLNPFSMLFIQWHSSKISSINELIDIFDISFDINKTIIILLVMVSIAELLCIRMIQKTDLLSSNKESEE